MCRTVCIGPLGITKNLWNHKFIHQNIFTIRGHRVMIDVHLAELYNVPTKALNQGVSRNPKRFPSDFMFQISMKEWEGVKKQISDSSDDTRILRSQIVTFNPLFSKALARRHAPFVFTEQGVAMLSSVLKSERAIEVNVAIIRAFVILRQHLSNYEELSEKIAALEKQMNRKFKDINEALNYLANRNSSSEIGFRQRQEISISPQKNQIWALPLPL